MEIQGGEIAACAESRRPPIAVDADQGSRGGPVPGEIDLQAVEPLGHRRQPETRGVRRPPVEGQPVGEGAGIQIRIAQTGRPLGAADCSAQLDPPRSRAVDVAGRIDLQTAVGRADESEVDQILDLVLEDLGR